MAKNNGGKGLNAGAEPPQKNLEEILGDERILNNLQLAASIYRMRPPYGVKSMQAIAGVIESLGQEPENKSYLKMARAFAVAYATYAQNGTVSDTLVDDGKKAVELFSNPYIKMIKTSNVSDLAARKMIGSILMDGGKNLPTAYSNLSKNPALGNAVSFAVLLNDYNKKATVDPLYVLKDNFNKMNDVFIKDYMNSYSGKDPKTVAAEAQNIAKEFYGLYNNILVNGDSKSHKMMAQQVTEDTASELDRSLENVNASHLDFNGMPTSELLSLIAMYGSGLNK